MRRFIAPVTYSSVLEVRAVSRFGEMPCTSLRAAMAATRLAGNIADKAATETYLKYTAPPLARTSLRSATSSGSPLLTTISTFTMRVLPTSLAQLSLGVLGAAMADCRSPAIFDAELCACTEAAANSRPTASSPAAMTREKVRLAEVLSIGKLPFMSCSERFVR